MTKLTIIRNEKLIQQNNLCYYCKQPMWRSAAADFAQNHQISSKKARLLQATAEHLIPKSEGGKDTPTNIVAACAYCNQHRHRTKIPLTPDAHQKKVKNRLLLGKWHGIVLR